MCWVVVTDIITFVVTLVLIISFPISFGCRLTWWAFLPLAAVLVPSWGLPYPGSPGFRCTWEDHWKLLGRGKQSELYVMHEPLTKEENTKFNNHNANWTTSWVNCWPLACEESLHCDQVKYKSQLGFMTVFKTVFKCWSPRHQVWYFSSLLL